MKKIFASFGWILLLLPLLSIAGTRTAINSITKIADSETRQVGPFSSVASAGSFDVSITMGAKESLRLEGDKEILKRVETVVENETLKIRFKKNQGTFSWKGNDVKVFITAKSLNGLTTAGSGNIKVDGTIKSEKLEAKVSGSGSISSNLDVSTFTAMISGSGKVYASGSAKSANIAISGSGDFKGEKLRTTDADLKVSGSGDASIHADNTLNAAVSGSGDISYSGNAKVRSSTSGSGSISRL
jgi:hypothetical protein